MINQVSSDSVLVQRTRVKICGITDSGSAGIAIDSGADALGLVFYEPSPRNLTIEKALDVASVAHPFVSLVGLFVNAASSQIRSVLNQVPLTCLQFHGDESVEFCESFGMPYIKVLRVGAQSDLVSQIQTYPTAQAILLDTYKQGLVGGTGESFNWDLIPEVKTHIILAGGLNESNVEDAIARVRPYAVDVSGGVESAPGVKDAVRMRAFLKQVIQADINLNV